MEYLRTCYATKFRLWVGGVERVVPARWFFAPAGAKEFPFPNAFCSNVWAKPGEESAPGPGEVDRSRVFDRGLNPGYLGQCTVGSPSWFADGMLPAGITDGPVPDFPACCGPGQAPVIRTCLFCPGGAPPAWTFLAEGFTGGLASLNGNIKVRYVGGCFWSLVTAEASWQVTNGFNQWILEGNNAQGSATFLLPIGATFDCLGPNLMELAFAFGGGAPGFITVFPST